jgi:hypothetical protein
MRFTSLLIASIAALATAKPLDFPSHFKRDDDQPIQYCTTDPDYGADSIPVTQGPSEDSPVVIDLPGNFTAWYVCHDDSTSAG